MTIRRESLLSKGLAEIAQYIGIENFTNVAITGISSQSDEVEVGDLFFAFAGAKSHGASFAQIAIDRGARAVMTDAAGIKILTEDAVQIPILQVLDPRKMSGHLSAWFYNFPMKSMYSVGVTGTNGKTTTSTLLHQIWEYARVEAGLIGTVSTRLGRETYASVRTTPEADELQTLVAVMSERHIRNLVMEVSSHALVQGRVSGSHFNSVAFTNLSQDHLDFHSNMEDYFQAKKLLFTYEYGDKAFINIDSEYGNRLHQEIELEFSTLSLHDKKAGWRYEKIEKSSNGYEIAIRGEGGSLIAGFLPLLGTFNLENALMAIALASDSGVDPLLISDSLSHLRGADGRLEKVSLGQDFLALVDYAHTPDAVKTVLAGMREFSSGKLIALLGCGGDRDRSKRGLMGKALLEGSDIAIFTSDNPRSENSKTILDQMTAGLHIVAPSAAINDRDEAIAYAISLAGSGDCVLLLGKGHEKGQEISGVVHPFDDRIELARAIEARI